MEKRKGKNDLLVLEDKNLGEICGRKRKKKLFWIGRGEKVRKVFEKI